MNTINPRQVLRLDSYLQLDHDLAVLTAQSQAPSHPDTIQVRVEWDGGANPGTFEVWNGNAWEACGNLSPAIVDNDLIRALPRLEIDSFQVSIVRGPYHGSAPFKARAYAIQWTNPPAQVPGSFSALRNVHYEYAAQMPVYASSTAATNGAQTAALTLDAGFDYELWIELCDPENANRWCIQDPIVSPGDRGGSPTPTK